MSPIIADRYILLNYPREKLHDKRHALLRKARKNMVSGRAISKARMDVDESVSGGNRNGIRQSVQLFHDN